MTLIAFQNGQPIFRGGLVGTGQACCCGGCSGPCSTTSDCAPQCKCVDGECRKCDCPSCEYMTSLCISATYTLRGCNGSFSNNQFSSFCDAASGLVRWASGVCGDFGGILITVACYGGEFGASASAGFLATPEGCFDTSPQGGFSIPCLSPPGFDGIIGSHSFDIKLADWDEGECANQVIGSVTVTITEPPC